jgi:hypothetical protein
VRAALARVRFETRFVLGALLALAGTVLLLGLPHGSAGDVRGAALALAAGLCYAGYLLLMRAARHGTETLPLLFLTSASATATLGLAAALRGDAFCRFRCMRGPPCSAPPYSQPRRTDGVVWSLRYLPATVTSVALLAQPVGTTLLGWCCSASELRDRGNRRRWRCSPEFRLHLARRSRHGSKLHIAARSSSGQAGSSPPNFLGFHHGKKPGMSLETFIVKCAGRFSRKLVTPS